MKSPPPTAPSTRQSYHLRTIHGGKAEPKSRGEGKKGGAPGSSLKLKTVDLYGYKERFDYEIYDNKPKQQLAVFKEKVQNFG